MYGRCIEMLAISLSRTLLCDKSDVGRNENNAPMNIVMIEETAFEQMKLRVSELTELVGNMYCKLRKPEAGA